MLEVFDALTVGFCIADLECRVLSADRRFTAMLGYTDALVTGFSMHAVTYPDDKSASFRINRHVVETGEPLIYRKRYKRADGQVFWVENRLSLMGTQAEKTLLIASVEAASPTPVEDRGVGKMQYSRSVCAKYIADIAGQLGAMADAHQLDTTAKLLQLSAKMATAEADLTDRNGVKPH